MRTAWPVLVALAMGAGCDDPPPATPTNPASKPCAIVGHDVSDGGLAAAYGEAHRPVLVVGNLAVACDCRSSLGGATERSVVSGATEEGHVGGATEAPKLGGATEEAKIGGATEGAHLGGATEGARIGGATEDQHIAGATEGSKTGGATEAPRIGGATEEAHVGGATEGARLGGAVEGSNIGGATGNFSCTETSDCSGFVFSGTATAIYDGKARRPVSGACISGVPL
jgi:hypothetical protein